MKSHDAALQEKYLTFLKEMGVEEDTQIAAEMLQSVVRLAKDQPGRAEMKLMARTLKELRYAFKVFKPYRNRRKVSIFGSARTPPTHPNYQMAVRFSKLLTESGFMVITGAGGGIMAAGHEGAGQTHSFGVAIRLPFEQRTNDIIAHDEKLIHFRYFFSRKLVFVKETHAIALFPGGFGTHDEGFEVLTLVQTGRCDPLPIVLIEEPGGTYWKAWDQFVRTALLGQELISPEDTHLYFITQDPQEAVRHIARFYRNYHSLRYVQQHLVLRLQQAPTPAELAQLQEDFKDIVLQGEAGGAMEIVAAQDVEPGSEVLPQAPRLRFAFDRHLLARLRMLIDRLNDLPSLPPEAAAPAVPAGTLAESDRGLGQIAEEESIKLTGTGNP